MCCGVICARNNWRLRPGDAGIAGAPPGGGLAAGQRFRLQLRLQAAVLPIRGLHLLQARRVCGVELVA